MIQVIEGDSADVLLSLEKRSVQCCVTSPPYFRQRKYGNGEELGQEDDHRLYIANLVSIFDNLWSVLKDDGTVWVVIGDGFSSKNRNGIKNKEVIGIPWLFAFAMRKRGWYIRSDIIISKTQPMPSSVTDRPTKSHEFLFLFTKQESYYYDKEAILEPWADKRRGNAEGKRAAIRNFGGRDDDFTRPALDWTSTATGRNKRSVWSTPNPPRSSHVASFHPAIPETCLLAGSREGDSIIDVFAGSGTTGKVAQKLHRNALLVEINPDYVQSMKTHFSQ